MRLFFSAFFLGYALSGIGYNLNGWLGWFDGVALAIGIVLLVHEGGKE